MILTENALNQYPSAPVSSPAFCSFPRRCRSLGFPLPAKTEGVLLLQLATSAGMCTNVNSRTVLKWGTWGTAMWSHGHEQRLLLHSALSRFQTFLFPGSVHTNPSSFPAGWIWSTDITDRESRHWNQGWQCLGSLVCLDRTTNFSRSWVQQHN